MVLLWMAAALAAPVEGGIQLGVFQPALDVGEGFVRGMTLDVAEDDISARFECWDRVGIEDFNLSVPIDDVQLELTPVSLRVTLTFGEIYGEDMVVYTVDEDWLDLCPELRADVLYVELTDAQLVLEVAPSVADGLLRLEIIDEPVISGDLDSDIDWVPDDLLLSWFEDAILETISSEMQEIVPDIVAEFLALALGRQAFGEFEFDIDIDDGAVGAEALTLGASVDVEWVGEDGCPHVVDEAEVGRNPELSFSGGGSSLAVGVTEAMVNEQLGAAFRDGYFCFTQENTAEFLDNLPLVFDTSVADLEMTFDLIGRPVVSIEPEGITVVLDELALEITADVLGERTSLLDVTGALTGVVEVAIDPVLASFTLSVHGLEVDFDRFDAEHLLSEREGAAEDLTRFVESWVVSFIARQMKDLVLFDARFDLAALALGFDRIEYEVGGVEVYATLYAADDPRIDREAPETHRPDVEVGTSVADFTVSATDDRPGALVYAHQVNGEGWSPWTAETLFRLEGLVEGTYRVQVKARDGWLNEDPTPASIVLEVGAGGVVSLPQPVCGCGTATGAAWWWLWVPLWVRRRR